MLGTLAKKLRLMGFDSEYFPDKPDDELVKIIQRENRILITKDEEFSNKAKKLGLEIIFVMGNDELEHFLTIKKKLKIESFSIKGDIARCTLCNGKLISVEKNQIINKIPKNIKENENSFWKCTSCKQIYWEGTHIIHLQNFVRILNDSQ